MAIRMSGLISGLDTESLVKELVSAQKLKNKKYSDQLTLSQWKEDKWKELNTKLYKLYTEDISKLRMTGNYTAKKVTSSNDNLVSVTGSSTAITGTYTITDVKMASNHFRTSGVITTDGTSKATASTTLSDIISGLGTGTVTVNIKDSEDNVKSVTVNGTTTMSGLATQLKAQGINASYDETQGRLFLSSTTAGDSSRFDIEVTSSITGANVSALKLATAAEAGEISSDDKEYATVVPGANSSFVLNGVTMTGTSNTVNVNGLTIGLNGATASGEKITLSVVNDVDAAYNSVKTFLTNYNALLKEMNTLYYADSSRGYAPLSDDEKAEMSDGQVEKWETKIQDSILRRDSTLGTLVDAMKTALTSKVQVGSSSYSLANYGIQTSKDYTEKGLLHIAGDADDSEYSTATNKLKAALEKDPDTVIATLSGVVKNLYDTMSNKMSSISNVRTAFTFYNDKLMDAEQDTMKKKVADLEDKLSDMEDRYYAQFTAMEKAMANMQSQSNALSGLMGTSS